MLCPGMEWGKVLLLLLALGTTWGSPWCGAQQTKTTSIKSRTFTLPSNCPTSCGNIRIQYPFGIGHGCYLPGFNLTCRQQYNSSVPARLFMGDDTLEVTSIDLSSGYVYFKLPVIRMGIDQSSITAPLIDLQNYHNFNFWATHNFLFVDGCNVNVSLVDLTNNNAFIYNCSTMCLDVGPDLSPFVIRRQNCSVQIGEGLPDRVSLGVHLTRLDQTQLQLTNATAVSADMRTSSFTVDMRTGSFFQDLEPKLSWYMDDHSSCAEAMNDMGTYACISSNSNCLNARAGDGNGSTVGYYCSCSGATKGNPYLTDGCQDVTANIHPADNCTRRCGSVDIPFPFGLDNESDCYRDSLFALFCNQTTTPPVLQYLGDSVTDVDVQNGELHIMGMRNAAQGHNLTYRYHLFIYDQFCEDAKKNMSLFACVSEHSTCHNKDSSKGDLPGYHCRCEEGYTGNPYVRNGCQDNAANIHPADNCTRECGSVDIPFPFGLDTEPDCYRDSSFALSCNETTTPPVLQYQDKNVTDVDVESGEVHLVEVTNSSQIIILTEGHYSWFIPHHSCEDAKRNKSLFACVGERSTCYNTNDSKGHQLGYRCGCQKGYTGNPYLVNGCQGIYLKTLPS